MRRRSGFHLHCFCACAYKHEGRSSILRLLLTGLAINALFMSGIGFLSYVARDPQARSIIYWNLGTLSGADWNAVLVVGAATVLGADSRDCLCQAAERVDDWRKKKRWLWA